MTATLDGIPRSAYEANALLGDLPVKQVAYRTTLMRVRSVSEPDESIALCYAGASRNGRPLMLGHYVSDGSIELINSSPRRVTRGTLARMQRMLPDGFILTLAVYGSYLTLCYRTPLYCLSRNIRGVMFHPDGDVTVDSGYRQRRADLDASASSREGFQTPPPPAPPRVSPDRPRPTRPRFDRDDGLGSVTQMERELEELRRQREESMRNELATPPVTLSIDESGRIWQSDIDGVRRIAAYGEVASYEQRAADEQAFADRMREAPRAPRESMMAYVARLDESLAEVAGLTEPALPLPTAEESQQRLRRAGLRSFVESVAEVTDALDRHDTLALEA